MEAFRARYRVPNDVRLSQKGRRKVGQRSTLSPTRALTTTSSLSPAVGFTGGSSCQIDFGRPGPLLSCSATRLLIEDFLEGPTVPRSKEVRVETSALFEAHPASSDIPSEDSDLIPISQVLEMAPVDLFELMGRKAKGKKKVAEGGQLKRLRKAAPEDILAWDAMPTGKAIHQIVRGLFTISFGRPREFLPMEPRIYDLEEILKGKDEKHAKAMAEVVEDATTSYKKLEHEHHNNINRMKDAEEKARTEAKQKAKAEAKAADLKEKVKLLEVECVKSIGLAREEGIQEGKKVRQEEMMDQGRNPSALSDAGPRNSDVEDEDDEDDEDEGGEVGGKQGTGPSAPVTEDPSSLPKGVSDPSALAPTDLTVSDPPAPSGPAPVDPAPPSGN
uniref:Uncharacterized protein n=1 Tax=Fagus sylvatica TaxID=28930 RepID=A0A2N9HBU5_FAGSY